MTNDEKKTLLQQRYAELDDESLCALERPKLTEQARELFDAELARRGLRPDVICVDPPRKGLAPEVVDAAAAMSPRRIVYVSCDPATLGRDVKRFAQHGYAAVRAAAVDLFPRTAHVETVVLLERDAASDGDENGNA